jgi:hypothetical protein
VASAARTANRVVTVTQSEIENTEDKKYMDELQRGSEEVGRSIPPMVTSAKSSITQPKNKEVFETFSVNADKVLIALLCKPLPLLSTPPPVARGVC